MTGLGTIINLSNIKTGVCHKMAYWEFEGLSIPEIVSESFSMDYKVQFLLVFISRLNFLQNPITFNDL